MSTQKDANFPLLRRKEAMLRTMNRKFKLLKKDANFPLLRRKEPML